MSEIPPLPTHSDPPAPDKVTRRQKLLLEVRAQEQEEAARAAAASAGPSTPAAEVPLSLSPQEEAQAILRGVLARRTAGGAAVSPPTPVAAPAPDVPPPAVEQLQLPPDPREVRGISLDYNVNTSMRRLVEGAGILDDLNIFHDSRVMTVLTLFNQRFRRNSPEQKKCSALWMPYIGLLNTKLADISRGVYRTLDKAVRLQIIQDRNFQGLILEYFKLAEELLKFMNDQLALPEPAPVAAAPVASSVPSAPPVPPALGPRVPSAPAAPGNTPPASTPFSQPAAPAEKRPTGPEITAAEKDFTTARKLYGDEYKTLVRVAAGFTNKDHRKQGFDRIMTVVLQGAPISAKDHEILRQPDSFDKAETNEARDRKQLFTEKLRKQGFSYSQAEAIYSATAARVAYLEAKKGLGRELLAAKRKELEASGTADVDARLKMYQVRELFDELELTERENLKALHIGEWTPREQAWYQKASSKWTGMNKWTRWGISAVVLTGYGAAVGHVVGGAAIAQALSLRILRAAGFSLASQGLGKAFEATWNLVSNPEVQLEKDIAELRKHFSVDALENIEASMQDAYARSMQGQKRRGFYKSLVVTGLTTGASLGFGLWQHGHAPTPETPGSGTPQAEVPPGRGITEPQGGTAANDLPQEPDNGGLGPILNNTRPPGTVAAIPSASTSPSPDHITAPRYPVSSASPSPENAAPAAAPASAPTATGAGFVETAGQHNSSEWSMAANQLRQHYGKEFNAMREGQRTNLIAEVVRHAGVNDDLEAGEIIDFSKVVGDPELMHKMIAHAQGLSEGQQHVIEAHNANIRGWQQAHPHEQLTAKTEAGLDFHPAGAHGGSESLAANAAPGHAQDLNYMDENMSGGHGAEQHYFNEPAQDFQPQADPMTRYFRWNQPDAPFSPQAARDLFFAHHPDALSAHLEHVDQELESRLNQSLGSTYGSDFEQNPVWHDLQRQFADDALRIPAETLPHTPAGMLEYETLDYAHVLARIASEINGEPFTPILQSGIVPPETLGEFMRRAMRTIVENEMDLPPSH